MLRYRLLSAVVIIACSLGFVALDAWFPVGQAHGFWMVPLGLYLMYGSAIECIALIRQSEFGPIDNPALIGTAGVMAAGVVPVFWPLCGSPYPADCLLGKLGWPLAASLAALAGSFVWHLRQYQTGNQVFIRSILAGWVAVYFGISFSFWIALRLTGASGWGLYLVVGMIVITKFSDAGAYFCGRFFGRTKLCPNVSPGKTVEGLVGGMIIATIVSWVYFKLCAPLTFGIQNVTATWSGVLLLGVLLTVAGLCGDLLQSIFKREVNAKDSGRLMPGLGGLWDVTDSLLPASVVGYLIVVAELIRGPGQ